MSGRQTQNLLLVIASFANVGAKHMPPTLGLQSSQRCARGWSVYNFFPNRTHRRRVCIQTFVPRNSKVCFFETLDIIVRLFA